MMKPLRSTLMLGALLLSAACASSGCNDDEASATTQDALVDTCAPGRSQAAIVTTLAFTRESPKGVAPGFDLDNLVSTGADEGSCNKVDFVSADGTPGIDNQLAALIPEIEAVVGNAVDGLIQGAINNGELMILLELEDLNDVRDDGCVKMSVQFGKGKPMIGTDGVVAGFQTFSFDSASPVSRGETGYIDNGVVTISPIEMALPFKIFDVDFTVHLHNGIFRYEMDENGFMKGYIGGSIVSEEILDGVKDGAGLASKIPLFRLALDGNADVAPDEDGQCRQISVALAFTAAPAFIRR